MPTKRSASKPSARPASKPVSRPAPPTQSRPTQSSNVPAVSNQRAQQPTPQQQQHAPAPVQAPVQQGGGGPGILGTIVSLNI